MAISGRLPLTLFLVGQVGMGLTFGIFIADDLGYEPRWLWWIGVIGWPASMAAFGILFAREGIRRVRRRASGEPSVE